MPQSQKDLYTQYLEKIEHALNEENFDALDYILEYMYSPYVEDEDREILDDILQEVTLYAELHEAEYKTEALNLIEEFK